MYHFTGKHLSSVGIHPSDTRDQYLRGTFHGYSLQNLLWGVAKPGSYFTHAVYPMKGECCSPISVTFSASEPDKMHMLNYLLYELRVLNDESRFGNVPAKVSVREEDVSFQRYVLTRFLKILSLMYLYNIDKLKSLVNIMKKLQ